MRCDIPSIRLKICHSASISEKNTHYHQPLITDAGQNIGKCAPLLLSVTGMGALTVHI
jgi:hypothetical protein